MLDSAIRINKFLLQYCRMMVADLADERLAEQPAAGMNHPAWILGHLTFSAERGSELLGVDKAAASLMTLYGPGSKPSASRGDYPSKDELLHGVEQSFERLRQRIAQATPEQLAKPTTNPRMKEALPTIQDVVAFLLTGHLGTHLGQLSSWRRTIGLPPLF
jgi:hypothetical protein